MADADVILLWGSNAREAHPIFFHHVIQAVRRGAHLIVLDPRRTPTVAWADQWVPVKVGGDIPLANAIGHVLVTEGLIHEDFVRHATRDFEAWRDHVVQTTPESVEPLTGVPAAQVRDVARRYGRARAAMICWTLGITEHHNAVDNVLALINLGLATGHVGRPGSGLNPLRGQNNVQGGGDSGALPHKLPGFQDVEDPVARARCEAAWGAPIPPKRGQTLTDMFHAMGDGRLKSLWILGENPVASEANAAMVRHCLTGLDHLVVQDLFLTRTAELAHVVLPGTAAWCETDGTVTNSERRVQRCRAAVPPPDGARDDIAILRDVAARLGVDLGPPTPAEAWEELRRVSPMHAGMSWARIGDSDGLQWPCPSDDHPGTPFLHGRLWERPVRGPLAPFHVVHYEPPVDVINAEFPILLTTGRKLDGYNTGVQSGHIGSPLNPHEAIELSPVDASALGLKTGDRARVTSRRGQVVTPVKVDPWMKPGLAFMAFHFSEQVDTNLLTNDAADLRAGTAELKAAAIRVVKVDDP